MFKSQVITVLILLCSSSVFANRLADEKYRKHCVDMPREECVAQLEWAKGKNCVTGDEYNYGSKHTIVPYCGYKDQFLGWCFCSCFAKGTPVLVFNLENQLQEWIAIEVVVAAHNKYRFVVPSSDATMSAMKYDTADISYWTAGEEGAPLVALIFDDSSELVLTENHSVLLASGQLVDAGKLEVGDILLKHDGSKMTINTVEMRANLDEVYNVWLETKEPKSHFLFAGRPSGLTVGDAFWENSSQEDVSSFKFPN